MTIATPVMSRTQASGKYRHFMLAAEAICLVSVWFARRRKWGEPLSDCVNPSFDLWLTAERHTDASAGAVAGGGACNPGCDIDFVCDLR